LEGLQIILEAESDNVIDAVTIVSDGSCTLRMCTIKSTTGSGVVVSGGSASAKVGPYNLGVL
jgi:hypothetical protein